MRIAVRLAAASAAVAIAASGLVAGVAQADDKVVDQKYAAEPLAPGVTNDENPRVLDGAAWSEAYFPSSAKSTNGDDVELHADILRPEGIPADQKTPVIMSVGTYFAHAGSGEDNEWEFTGPSDYWYDFLKGADVIGSGYTYVTVDLRGFGGSTGCIEMMGAGDQADVKSAVEWAAAQPWSNGKVGLFGSSYDASTGLMGVNEQPEGLAAAVAQEPVWSVEKDIYSNQIPNNNQIGTPETYDYLSTIGGYSEGQGDIPPDTEQYLSNAAYEERNPECVGAMTRQFVENTTADAPFWRERNLAERVNDSEVPLFFTQGFLETVTKPEAMDTYLTNHRGPQRAWLGPWSHFSGFDQIEEGVYLMGRDSFFDEVMSFYDEYLTDTAPTTDYANFYIQDNLGQWRAQETWPVTERSISAELPGGTYTDDGTGETQSNPYVNGPDPQAVEQNSDRPNLDDAYIRRDGPGRELRKLQSAKKAGKAVDEQRFATISEPVSVDTRLTGTPSATLATSGERNVMLQLWDVRPDGLAVMFNEQAAVLDASGVTEFDLKSNDWTLQEGHSLGVTIGTVTNTWWWPTPSNSTVTVESASLELDLASTTDDVAAEGAESPWLEKWVEVFTDVFPDVEPSFQLSLDDPGPTPTPTGSPEPTPTEPTASGTPVPTPSGTPTSPAPSGTPTSPAPTGTPTSPAPGTPAPTSTSSPTAHPPGKPHPPLAETGGAEFGALLAAAAAVAAGAMILRRRTR